MTNAESSNLLQRVTLNWAQQNFDEAFSDIRTVIEEGSLEMQVSALLLSGMINDDLGNIFEARSDWQSAIPLSTEGSFAKYSLQSNIGESYAKEGEFEKAIGWFRNAIETCAGGDEFSGEKALSAFQALNNGIPEKDARIVALAIEKSWRVLELPGFPDLSNLSGAILGLAQEFENIVKQTKGDF